MTIRISILLVGLLVLSSCRDKLEEAKSNSNKPHKREALLVNTIIAKNFDFQKQIIANGKIEALQKSELRFKTSERLSSIKVKNGQIVNRGQLLAHLDNEALTNQINKAKLDLDKAKSKLQEEKINYGLDEQNETKIDSEILRSLQIRSGYLEAKNALENAQFEYNQTFLRAPFSGVVANIEAKTNNYITSSDVFCTLISPKQLIVSFSILENELSFLKKTQDVDIISFVDSDKKFKGTITEINPIVDKNGLVKVGAKITNPDDSLFDGMSVKTIIYQPLKNVIVIPKEALVLRSNREVVFTVQDSLAKWNYVKVLDENSTSYAIKEGLKLGDTLIVSGNMNLSHDAKVNATFMSEQEDSN